jgi:hypothetical protein
MTRDASSSSEGIVEENGLDWHNKAPVSFLEPLPVDGQVLVHKFGLERWWRLIRDSWPNASQICPVSHALANGNGGAELKSARTVLGRRL